MPSLNTLPIQALNSFRSLLTRSSSIRPSFRQFHSIQPFQSLRSQFSTCVNCDCYNDDNRQSDPNEEKLTVRQKCDPYEQKGKPLDETTIKQCLKLLSSWTYDNPSKTLNKKYSFRSNSLTPQQSIKMMFQCVNQIHILSTNTNHHPYEIRLTPRKSEVEIILKTIQLQGISYVDLDFAMKCDGIGENLLNSIQTTSKVQR